MRMIVCGIVLGVIGSLMVVANLSWVNWSDNPWAPVAGFLLGNTGAALLAVHARRERRLPV